MALTFWSEASPEARKALVAAAMGWLLDAFDVMLYALILTSVIEELGLTPGAGRADGVADARRVGGRRAGLRRARRQARTHARAVAQHPALFGVHVRVRVRAEPLAVRDLPRPARPRHGRRVGERRDARQRNVAGEASRQGARHHAELLGDRLRPGRDRRRDRAAALRMARGVLRRHPSRALHALDSAQRERTGDVDRQASRVHRAPGAGRSRSSRCASRSSSPR